jgi:glycosyltransferase involved in cell wall biosynthesis
LRIALVTRRFPPFIGGAERVLRYLASALSAAGAEVSVFTSRLDRRLAACETVGDPSSTFAVERLATSPLRFVGTLAYMRALHRRLQEVPLDVIYVSMLKHDAYVAVAVGRSQGIPVILRPEGAGLTGDLAWQSWGRFGRRIGRRCKQADAIVAISSAVRAELVDAGYDADRLHDLPNGVPVPEEAWRTREALPKRAIFIGRLAPEKGLDTLIQSWKTVAALGSHVELVLVGSGPERASLVAQADGLGIGSIVRWTGAISDTEEVLRTGDVFVLPSREEGMSIALLEAMALGIPIVATDIPGNRRIVENQVHGLLVPPDEPEALARGIREQWQNPRRASEMGSAARERVRAEYSIEQMAKRHLELFERLVRESRSRRGAAC